MLTKEDIQNTLKEYNLAPNKLLGQHFLLNTDIIDLMIESANLEDVDTLVEVGPGLGVLTERLLATGKKVVTIEKDKGIARTLEKKYSGLQVINDDVLTCNIPELLGDAGSYSVIANLPYNITARFINLMLSGVERAPVEVIVMIQKEVAERLVAKPGDLTKIGLMAQVYSDPEILIDYIEPQNFYPEPKVNSAVVKMVAKLKPLKIFPQESDFEKTFWRLVRIGFASKRKKLTNNLSSGLKISTQKSKEMLTLAGIDPSVRAEDMSVDDWVKTVDICVKNHCR